MKLKKKGDQTNRVKKSLTGKEGLLGKESKVRAGELWSIKPHGCGG